MKVFITGTAGFIGFHLAKVLLENNHQVHGYDGITEYYDINLKERRHEILENYSNFSKTIGMLENNNLLMESTKLFKSLISLLISDLELEIRFLNSIVLFRSLSLEILFNFS